MKRKQAEQQHFETITELLRQNCGKDDRPLFIEKRKDGQIINHNRWEQELLETAGKIQALDAKHIGVVCDLTYGCVLCLFAVMVAGKVVVPLEADLPGETLDCYIEKGDIQLLLYNEDHIDGTVSRCEALTISEFLSRPGETLPQWPSWEGSRDACIFFTSGTEGEPNGVLLTQKHMAFVTTYSSQRPLNRSPRILHFLPLHHVFSFLTLVACIADDCEIYLSGSIKYVSRELAEVKPDVLITVPLFSELLRGGIRKGIENSGKAEQIAGLIKLSNGLRKLGIDLRTPLFRKLRDGLGGIPQLLITGGSASSVETIRFFDDIGIIVLQAYGMTETACSITTNSLKKNRHGSVGHPRPYNQVRIKDSEIQVRGENVMKEYYKNPEATERAFDNGWFRTGDLGYLDRDGYLFITGRKKNLIILSNGENVSPEELEAQLMRCEAIEEVVVMERQGRIHAEIFPKGDETTIRQAVDTLNRQNPVYKRITSWELRDTPFDKTSSLKIRR